MSFLGIHFMKTCALLSVISSRDINIVMALGAIVQNKGKVIVCLEYTILYKTVYTSYLET